MKSELSTAGASLPEVHGSVSTANLTVFRRMLAFAGPAYLVSVGYMDPGNWATDLEGGARFGYRLLWVLVVSNLMAILLQTLAARLGIVAGRDLAQACRESYSRRVCNALWVLCEIAISACDLAEVLGAAIALRLLFGLPLLVGVLVTALDTLLVLWLSRYGIRLIEAVILSLIAIVTGCFLVELVWARPVWHEMAAGLLPRLNSDSLYVAIGILGATVMPHNLYLHSALVQTRRLGKTVAERREACRFNLFDSVLALNGALIVNAAILVLAAAVFFKHGILVTQIEQAQLLLTPLLGMGLAGSLFAVALLASGQSSTLTGTYAGQIVMEGFLSLRLRPWLRRLVTRAIAIIPAVLTIYYLGDNGTYKLLILSQVILSMQLPFAVIPLIRFTNDSRRMGEFANRAWVRVLAWGAAALIIALNLWLVATTIGPWMAESVWHAVVAGLPVAAVLALLARVTFVGTAMPVQKTVSTGAAVAADLPVPHYRNILVPLDHSSHDRAAIAHAVALARSHGATLHLLHVEEGVTSQLFGSLSSTEEIISGEEYFGAIVQSLAASGIAAKLTIQHGLKPTNAIVRKAREIRPDLIVMGAHGHRGLKDLMFGNTINAVRHQVDAPVLVVGGVTTPIQ
ncbi:MAG TPA: Nramp family divalent metal transporter [Bryobacteraceae bacterium]|nr:Nramp family divalent metal transporter [Bryobacteraceae bacterium]